MLNIYNSITIPKMLDEDYTSTDAEEGFIISVKPPKKQFQSEEEKLQFVQEYTKKKKTELCNNYRIKGFCPFGSECSYAHGLHELVPKTHLHNKYKTKLCKSFFSEGFCRYGIRCQYLHEEPQKISTKQCSKKLQIKAKGSSKEKYQREKLAKEHIIQQFANIQKNHQIALELEINSFSSRLGFFKRLTDRIYPMNKFFGEK